MITIIFNESQESLLYPLFLSRFVSCRQKTTGIPCVRQPERIRAIKQEGIYTREVIKEKHVCVCVLYIHELNFALARAGTDVERGSTTISDWASL